MKVRLPLLVIGFLLAVLFSACTTPPQKIKLPNADFPIPDMVLPGVVIFQASPQEVSNPVPASKIASLVIRGQARLENPANLTIEFYASAQDPAELGCQPVPDTEALLVCDPNTSGIEKVGKVEFKNSAGPEPLLLKGNILARAANKGAIYFGISISGVPQKNHIYLENMEAIVMLRLGF